MKDIERRKRVMQRSIRLGHCICDPKKPCPCDLFKEKDICLCAGERLDAPTGPVQLTNLVEKAGCASKIDQAFLKQVLKDLPTIDDPRVLVGVPAGDDAGIYDMGDAKALVLTVDVFTPSVDDPYAFGQVAAANSVSDIYAMGATPLTALSVLGFPARRVPDNVMTEILTGGIDKMKEAGVAVIGGHSINDDQIKAGFAVTGIIEKTKIVTNAGARPGDVLVLTKPLGTGILTFAAQIGRADSAAIQAATESMAALNKNASRLMVEFAAHACTDVTGFSLMGHLSEMALASAVDVEILWDDVPLFPGVTRCLADGVIPGAAERNKDSCADRVVAGENVSQPMLDICFDAQTSGGLLIAIPSSRAQQFLSSLHAEGVTTAAIIGKVLAEGSGLLYLKTNRTRRIPPPTPGKPSDKPVTAGVTEPPADVPCCADEHTKTDMPAAALPQTSDIQRKFLDFLKSANTPGELDAYTKQAINIALSVLAKCGPCLKTHIKKATSMGFSQKEIDEAAWMGISFGGSPTMVFYQQLKNS